MSAEEFENEEKITEIIEEETITDKSDAQIFLDELENYLPTPENTDKIKKPLPAWLTSVVTSFAVCFVVLTAYTLIIFPHIRPSAVISYSKNEQGSDITEVTGLSEMIEKNIPCIVSVSGKADYRSFFGISTQTVSGSGIIISENGYILTSNSLIGSNGETTVIIGKESYSAKLVGQDAVKDIAIIKIDASGLPHATLGDSDSVKTGDTAIAIAYVLGGDIGVSATRGIICGVNKGVSLSNGSSVNLIQTDVMSGASSGGGCLLDANGNVIGMLTNSISSNTDKIAFAIPSNDILSVAESIINTGIAPSGLIIGIKGSDAEHGVTVDSVLDDTPAKKAGIEKGDLILKADGTVVKSVSEINKIRDTHKKGDIIILTIYRNGEIMDISITL